VAAGVVKVAVPANAGLLQTPPCACGGGCSSCAEPLPRERVQTKLDVSSPGDQYEEEADRVAEQVMRMPVPTSTTGFATFRNGVAGEPERPGRVLRKIETIPGKANPVSDTFDLAPGPGQALDSDSRNYFEPRFGQDFGNVRIHSGPEAAMAASSIQARAFTLGTDVVFAAGEHDPSSESGKHLLAHELTHVVQQGRSRSSDLKVQRACGPTAIGPTPNTCALVSSPLGLRRYLFKRECDEFETGEEGRLRTDLALLPAGTSVSILGCASSDGNQSFNEALSCARARATENAIRHPPPSAPSPPLITSVKAVGAQGPADDRTFRAVSIEFNYPTPGSFVPPSQTPGSVLDPGAPGAPGHPILGFAACQAIPPTAAAICGSAFTGLSCPAWFCTPFPTVAIARVCRDESTPVLLAGITAIVGDTRVTPFWALYLRGGTSSQMDMSPTFGADFAADAVSVRASTYLRTHLQTYLASAASVLFVGPGPWTIDFSSSLATEIANLEVAGHPQEMVFAPATNIPGLLAGGVGLNQSTCSAGLVPSAFDDHRRAKVSATVRRTASGAFLVAPTISFRVEDTIDFCPGNCGTGGALAATVLLSRLEASGISGDVPFLVDYKINPPPFTV
jgi:hypothetical protein